MSGRVTLDGVAIAEGDIIFAPNDSSKAEQAGKITNGQFELMATVGPNKVRIEATRELPKKGEFSYFENIIPEKYNKASQLSLEVPSGGQSDVAFELKSK